MTLNFTDVGLLSQSSAEVRDLYARQSLGVFTGAYTAQVPLHGVVVLRVTPLRAAERDTRWRPTLLR